MQSTSWLEPVEFTGPENVRLHAIPLASGSQIWISFSSRARMHFVRLQGDRREDFTADGTSLVSSPQDLNGVSNRDLNLNIHPYSVVDKMFSVLVEWSVDPHIVYEVDLRTKSRYLAHSTVLTRMPEAPRFDKLGALHMGFCCVTIAGVLVNFPGQELLLGVARTN